MITGYKIVCSADHESTESEVNGLIRRGWEPLGGLVLFGDSCKALYQAMIRRESAGSATLVPPEMPAGYRLKADEVRVVEVGLSKFGLAAAKVEVARGDSVVMIVGCDRDVRVGDIWTARHDVLDALVYRPDSSPR